MRDVRDVSARGEVEHALIGRDPPQARRPAPDRQLYRARQLELAAHGERHVAASFEDLAGKAPAVHADERRRGISHRGLVRLLEDRLQVAVGPDNTHREGTDALGRDVALRKSASRSKSTVPCPDMPRSAESAETGYRLSELITRKSSPAANASAARTASAVPSGFSWIAKWTRVRRGGAFTV